MADFDSTSADMREEAIRNCARWAASTPACHVALAKALSARSEDIGQIFFAKHQAPLTEMYPMAASLRSLTCGPSVEAKRVLCKSLLVNTICTNKLAVNGLPPLVSQELSLTQQCMQKPVKKTKPAAVAFLSNTSTCCPDISASKLCDDDSILASLTSATRNRSQLMSDPKAISKLVKMLQITDSLFEPNEVA